MTYTRSLAMFYVVGEYQTLLTELGMSDQDAPGGVKGILDQSFRAMGVGQADVLTATVTDSNVNGLEAALDYFALLRFSREAANRVSITKSDGVSTIKKDRQQLAEHLAKLVVEARDRATQLGVQVAGPDFEIGAFNRDYLEPGTSAGGVLQTNIGWWG